IRVEDTGVGISEVDLPQIFNRFFRGQARTPAGKTIDPRGLGQGLFIARAVAEAHHGYLSVDSKSGIGSVFTLAIPAAGSPLIELEPPSEADATAPSQALELPPGQPEDKPEN